MPLPDDFMTEFLPSAKNVTILGTPIMSLTKKELAASIVFLISEVEEHKAILSQVSTYQSPKQYSRSH